MKVYGQLENAALENLSTDPTAAVQGRVYLNTTTSTAMLDDGTVKRALLRNDSKIIIGTDATAGNNVRLHHAGVGLLQFVLSNDTTAENTASTNLAQIGLRASNLAAAPATGNIGRLFYNTTSQSLNVETSAGFLQAATLTGSETLTNKTLTAPKMDVETFTDQSTTPSTPASGLTKFYTKAGLAYKLGSDGIETLLAAGTNINARYTDTAGMALPVGTTKYIYGTTVYATTGLTYASGNVTVTTAGKYRVSAKVTTAQALLSTTQALSISLYKNGSTYSELGYTVGSGGNTNYATHGTDTIQLAANDVIAIYVFCNVAVSTIAGPVQNHFSIEYIGA